MRQRHVYFVSAPAQAFGQIDEMSFASAQGPRRSDLQDSHGPENRRKDTKAAIRLRARIRIRLMFGESIKSSKEETIDLAERNSAGQFAE